MASLDSMTEVWSPGLSNSIFSINMPIPFDIPTVAAAAVVCICLYQFIVHPAFISPLSKIPAAHPTASISPAWILWKRFTFREIRTIHEAHQRLGPVIRLGPKEISINCVKGGIQTVYSGGFEKHAWYPNLFDNYG
jgi:unspecific monooxygenase